MNHGCGIYKITNTTTGDYYIGSANNIQQRIYWHQRHLVNNTHYNSYLQRAWNKYGKQAFEFTTLLLCGVERKLYFEQGLLNLFKPTYNIAVNAIAAMQGRHHSEETKRRQSETHKGELNYAFGKHLSDEHKLKLSKANKGKPSSMLGKHRTEETKFKMSKAQKGNTHGLGHKHSDESRVKIGEARKGKNLSEETRHKISESRKRYYAEKKIK